MHLEQISPYYRKKISQTWHSLHHSPLIWWLLNESGCGQCSILMRYLPLQLVFTEAQQPQKLHTRFIFKIHLLKHHRTTTETPPQLNSHAFHLKLIYASVLRAKMWSFVAFSMNKMIYILYSGISNSMALATPQSWIDAWTHKSF